MTGRAKELKEAPGSLSLIHMMDEEAANGGVPKPILHTSATGGKAYAKSEANEADVVMENDPE